MLIGQTQISTPCRFCPTTASNQWRVNVEKINFKKLNRPTGLHKDGDCVLRVASLPYYESFGLAFEAGLCKSFTLLWRTLAIALAWWPLCSSDGCKEHNVRIPSGGHQRWAATWFCWQSFILVLEIFQNQRTLDPRFWEFLFSL